MLTALAMTMGLGVVAVGPAKADEGTISQDIARTGWDQNEPGLNPGAVSSSSFGLLYQTALQGQIYAQPLAVNGTLVVGTENDYVYGLNEQTGAINWSVSLGSPWPASTISCGDLTPNIGVTSTPVYDPATGWVYVTAKVNDGADAAHPHWYMEALDPASGQVESKMTIGGSPSNAPGVTFDPELEMQRPGLLLLNGSIYAAFGAHCDHGAYRGYVVGVDATTMKQTAMWTDEAVSSNVGGGIWQSGSGLTSDGTNIYLATGNGIGAPVGPGDKPPTSLSESVVKLAVNSDGSLSATDFFSPANAPTLDSKDLDFASGGPVLLPNSFGTASVPHVVVQEGKDGRVFLLNADNLGGRSQGANGTDAAVNVVGPIEGQWDHPAVWGGDGGYVYLVGNNGALRALKSGVDGQGSPSPTLTIAGASADKFGYTSGSPVVTSNGTASGSAVVWVEWASGPTGAGAQLRAYNAVPDNNGVLDLLYSVPIGTSSKFATPMTDGGKVVVGTRDGNVMAYGSPANTPVTATSVSFANTAVGQTATATATITANQAVTITGVSTTAPFGAGTATFPTTLAAGGSMQIPLTYSPTAAGTSVGVLSVATSAGTVGLGLNGFGVAPGLSATPRSLTFPAEPTGSSDSQTIEIQNTTGQAETVNSYTLPSAPYQVTGMPATGTVVQPGNSFVITVVYAPTVTSAGDSANVTITSTSGTVTIPVSGSAVAGAGNLVLGPTTTDFGAIELGTSSTMTFTMTNTGNLPVTVSKAKAPDSEFSSADPLPEGIVIGPGQTVDQTVTFTAAATGTATDQYEISPADGQGAMYENFTATVFTGRHTVPAPAAATWHVNGKAAFVTGGVRLTDSGRDEAGTAFYTRPVPTNGLTARFTAQFVKRTGADGLAFAMVDATQAQPTALGGAGGGIGLSGIPGAYGVVLDSFYNAQAKSANYVALMGPTAARATPTYLATAVVPTSLETGTHSVSVTNIDGYISIAVDGKTLIHTAVTLPQYIYAGFGGGTGGYADTHIVTGASIRYGQIQVPGATAAYWHVNGKAAFVTGGVRLTDSGRDEAGTAFSSQSFPTAGFTARFTAQFVKRTGADGLAFAVVDATQAGPTSLGWAGNDFGLGGIPGAYGVALDSYWNAQARSSNYIGLMGPTPARTTPAYLATAPIPASLETGTHVVVVNYYNGTLTATVDGAQLISTAVALPPTAYFGFGGGTGGLADTHIVTGVVIVYN